MHQYIYACIYSKLKNKFNFINVILLQDYSISSIKMRDSSNRKRSQCALVRMENREKVEKEVTFCIPLQLFGSLKKV